MMISLGEKYYLIFKSKYNVQVDHKHVFYPNVKNVYKPNNLTNQQSKYLDYFILR